MTEKWEEGTGSNGQKKDKLKQIHVDLTPEMHHSFKIFCVKNQISMQNVILRFIEKTLELHDGQETE